jgi:protoheme IX farnesyltransferase
LPARRLAPETALRFGLALAVVSVLILFLTVNSLTAVLGLVAFVSYVLLYTPLKQKSHIALLVGAVPGALPPLMGWTAATDSIALPGLALFFILFLWQIPHFLAIALFHKEEFARAGIRVLPVEKGEETARHWIVRYLAGLFAVSLYPVVLGVAGTFYFWTAFVLGMVFFSWGCAGLRRNAGLHWARNFFIVSIVYLPLLLLMLVVGRNT